MRILFVLSDGSPSGYVKKFAEAAQKRIGKEAEVVYYSGEAIRTLGEIDGVWIFTHEERGGCPENISEFLENNFSALQDIPSVAAGIGGKEGAMNAVTEIYEFFETHDGRILQNSEPFCVPLRSARFDLDHDEKMELIFLVDSFLKYCGMDESDSRKICFETVVNDYFKILKLITAEKPELLELTNERLTADGVTLDLENLPDGAPSELLDMKSEIEELCESYELDEEEILPALKEKIQKSW